MTALVTNLITNLLLALCLFYWFTRVLVKRIRGDHQYTRSIATVFFTLFIISFLGFLTHGGLNSAILLSRIWLAIGFGVVFLNYSLIYAIKVPEVVRVLVVLIALLFLYAFVITEQFIFIALTMIFIYILASIYSQRLTRVGFLAIVLSNLLWIIMREGANYELGYTLPIEYRYDNDIYHILLVISIYLVYKSIKEGDWSYPNQDIK